MVPHSPRVVVFKYIYRSDNKTQGAINIFYAKIQDLDRWKDQRHDEWCSFVLVVISTQQAPVIYIQLKW